MAQTLQTLSVISFVIAGACLVLAVFFWLFFKIPTVIGDLSGRTAKKSIAKMRAANEKTGTKSYKESRINAERGKLTGTIPNLGKPNKSQRTPHDGKPETGLLTENKADGFESEATGMLDEATSILGSETTGLLVDDNATAPLASLPRKFPAHSSGKQLEMIEEVMLVHTGEVIE